MRTNFHEEFENLGEINFLKNTTVPQLAREEIEGVNSPISMKEIEL